MHIHLSNMQFLTLIVAFSIVVVFAVIASVGRHYGRKPSLRRSIHDFFDVEHPRKHSFFAQDEWHT